MGLSGGPSPYYGEVPLLITAEEVGVQNRTTYEGEALAQVNSFIQAISAAIETYSKRTYSEPVPAFIKSVALIEVRRLLNSEPGVANERIGDLATAYEFTALLSNSAKADLKAYLRWMRPGISTIRLFSPNYKRSSLPAPTLKTLSLSDGDLEVTGRTPAEGLAQIQYSSDGFEWVDMTYTHSLDRSDGDLPAFKGILAGPTSGSYKVRARWRYDDDTSGWSLPKTVEVP